MASDDKKVNPLLEVYERLYPDDAKAEPIDPVLKAADPILVDEAVKESTAAAATVISSGVQHISFTTPTHYSTNSMGPVVLTSLNDISSTIYCNQDFQTKTIRQYVAESELDESKTMVKCNDGTVRNLREYIDFRICSMVKPGCRW